MLLLEFQSTSDASIALRMLAYTALLWQHLEREKQLLSTSRLPPVLPVVVYNGKPEWRAARSVHELIGLEQGSPLWQWQPDARYHLIAVRAFSLQELEARDGLPALLFRLEAATSKAATVAATDALIVWFARYPGFEAERTVIREMLGTLLGRGDPDVRVPDDLQEIRTMLAARVDEWLEEAKQEGRQEGRQAGRQEGRRAGEADLLIRLLEHRFGALPEWARARVEAANIQVLEEWGLRVLDAANLDQVFR